jgi:hypothetical protein
MATTVRFDKKAQHADPDVLSDSEEDHRPFMHMRTASVIVESGARVRRNITLAPEVSSEEDESSPLINGSSSGTGYSGVSRDIAARDLKPSRKDRFIKWLRSENPKR